ncbi:hypothetical protein BESB_063540 [Besnoitia besnoiti]|uniref:Uncharacterized protein n=1 Tax=Besnoitia besnoiti TaxID=94643 RepID=A0A2A9MIQ3_BESBE|nr:hypothetical protein BESB_063540 [Besnoitia besnoiti]PFH35467.1 hypothetical protein BESB_063540 [Besnoitia besnoiti]
METIEGTQNEIAKGFKTLQRINTRFRRARVRLYDKEASLLLATAAAAVSDGSLEALRRKLPSSQEPEIPPFASAKGSKSRSSREAAQIPTTLSSPPGKLRDSSRAILPPATGFTEISSARRHSKSSGESDPQPPRLRDMQNPNAVSKRGDHQPFGGSSQTGASAAARTGAHAASTVLACHRPQRDIPACILDLVESHANAMTRTILLTSETEALFKPPDWILQERRRQQQKPAQHTEKRSESARSDTRRAAESSLLSASTADELSSRSQLASAGHEPVPLQSADSPDARGSRHENSACATATAEQTSKSSLAASEIATASDARLTAAKAASALRASSLRDATQRSAGDPRGRGDVGFTRAPDCLAEDGKTCGNSPSCARQRYLDDRGGRRLLCRTRCGCGSEDAHSSQATSTPLSRLEIQPGKLQKSATSPDRDCRGRAEGGATSASGFGYCADALRERRESTRVVASASGGADADTAASWSRSCVKSSPAGFRGRSEGSRSVSFSTLTSFRGCGDAQNAHAALPPRSSARLPVRQPFWRAAGKPRAAALPERSLSSEGAAATKTHSKGVCASAGAGKQRSDASWSPGGQRRGQKTGFLERFRHAQAPIDARRGHCHLQDFALYEAVLDKSFRRSAYVDL